MTECEEIAESLYVNAEAIITFADALVVTKRAMEDETNQVIAEVAHALFAFAVRHATIAAISPPR